MIIALAIPFAAKAIATSMPLMLRFKPFNCDNCLTFWLSLIYFKTSTDLTYLDIGLLSFANMYFCMFLKNLFYKWFKAIL